MNVTLYVTRDCNLACRYCYAGRKRPERMSLELARRAVALAMDNSQFTSGVRFFGGEPLMEWEFVKRLTLDTLTAARKRKLLPSFSISSNAMFLQEKHIAFFEEHDFAVGISIDGVQKTHDLNRRDPIGNGSFDAVREKFLMIRDRDVRLSVEIVADPSTIDCFADSIQYLVQELGVSFIIVSINVFAGWTAEHVKILRGQYEKMADFYLLCFQNGVPFEIDVLNNKMNVILRGGYDMSLVCQLGQTEITVVPDGRIYPCLRIVGFDEKGDTIIGTINEGFYEEKRSSMLAQSKTKPVRCLVCPNDGICINWCASTNFVLSGSLEETGDFLCNYERAVIDVSRDLLSRIDMDRYLQMYNSYLLQPCSRSLSELTHRKNKEVS